MSNKKEVERFCFQCNKQTKQKPVYGCFLCTSCKKYQDYPDEHTIREKDDLLL